MTGPDRGGSAGDRQGTHDVVNLPNIITFARLCAVPLAVWLVLRQQMGLAFVVFAVAGVSDAVDGWLARRRGGSALGAIMDPVADKALLVSMFVTLAATGVLPDWLAILVVFRDLVIVGGIMVMWQLSMPVRIKPLWFSKLNTALQLSLVGVVLLLEGFGLRAPWLRLALIWTVAATTLVSGAAYVWKAARAR
ncbi:MAG: CDP-alcohol phosphatidyltransferase family protein [Gemmatimonadaceae bacterium]|nr:CDP-alcohol phosphatidyltransferase family protein [Acetobacteraceae bacterium]